MIDAATETLRGTAGWIRLGTLEDLDEDGGAYDVVISRMAFHYVENLDRLLGACARCLRPVPGWSSPSCTPSSPHTTGAPVRENGARSWEVDDYFDRGPREQAWLGGSVIWHHRTVEDHVVALQRAGFTLSGLSEAEPETVRFEGDDAEHARRRRIPLFLLLAGQRT